MPGPPIQPAEYEIFANPPLKAMLGQVRFPPVLRIADLAALGAFQDDIREDWPNFSQEQQISLVIGPGASAQSGPQQVFRFTSADEAWSVVLAPDAVSVEAAAAGNYSSFDEFAKRFRQIWEAILEHFAPALVVRQGLRYVDHIEADLDPLQWAELINSDLLGPVAGPLATGLEQAVSELRFRDADGILVFKHGIVPAGPENRNGYLLDFDCFTDEPNQETTTEAVVARFDRYHEVLYSLFRWCVTDKALEGFRNAG